ncbi:FitA-like ribbon-helix-helix domain-containing protein [Rhodoplanes sp. SY1]|uniref:FitA-like ribbon-helix-helix domain-containing protein n=1 Tax=Rhodoplanes sp. SY1 TaxID=3166646 RepID=UPI0038B66503
MGEILVRNLDDAVIARLERRAALNGRSLEQELREVLAAAAPERPRLSPEQKLERSRRLLEDCPDLGDFDVSAAIRFGRDDEDSP